MKLKLPQVKRVAAAAPGVLLKSRFSGPGGWLLAYQMDGEGSDGLLRPKPQPAPQSALNQPSQSFSFPVCGKFVLQALRTVGNGPLLRTTGQSLEGLALRNWAPRFFSCPGQARVASPDRHPPSRTPSWMLGPLPCRWNNGSPPSAPGTPQCLSRAFAYVSFNLILRVTLEASEASVTPLARQGD